MSFDAGKMLGPLPLGGWVAVVGGGLGLAYVVNRKKNTPAAVPTETYGAGAGPTIVLVPTPGGTTTTIPPVVTPPVVTPPPVVVPDPVVVVPPPVIFPTPLPLPAPDPVPQAPPIPIATTGSYTDQMVRDLYTRYGLDTLEKIRTATWVPSSESGQDRVSRNVRELNAGIRSWDQLEKSVSELPHHSPVTAGVEAPNNAPSPEAKRLIDMWTHQFPSGTNPGFGINPYSGTFSL